MSDMSANRLITISISHYCEKARWALDRADIAYVEEPHAPVFQVAYARRAGGGRTVPVLVAGDGEVVGESSEILRWVDRRLGPGVRLYPAGAQGEQAARLEAWLDTGLGPDGRLWMYQTALPMAHELVPWLAHGAPRSERFALRWGSPVIAAVVRRVLRVSPQNAVAALGRVDVAFDEVAAILSDGRPYLCGDRFTAADLTFASLAAPVLAPETYGSPLPPRGALPPAMATEVSRLRDHEAGRFALRIGREQRRRVVA